MTFLGIEGRLIPDKDVMRLLTQVIARSVEWDGTFTAIQLGMGQGSPLFFAGHCPRRALTEIEGVGQRPPTAPGRIGG